MLPEGSVFHGRYRVVRCIKAGGMGAVYEAVHLETRRRRALKVMLPSMVASAEMRERFKLEATVAADVESDHIVETFDAGVDQETGAPFLVTELLRGEDLAALLLRRGRLPPDETVTLLGQAAKALDKTHAAGIVHRDLKPDNLFVVRRDDDPPRLKILDFGIAKVVAHAAQTDAASRTVGTPVYMALEQIKGTRLGPATDLYALGHIAYQLLVGEAYWSEELALEEAIYPLLLRGGARAHRAGRGAGAAAQEGGADAGVRGVVRPGHGGGPGGALRASLGHDRGAGRGPGRGGASSERGSASSERGGASSERGGGAAAVEPDRRRDRGQREPLVPRLPGGTRRPARGDGHAGQRATGRAARGEHR
jgi:eukaryotic-like serine/threonine-protein kinase